MYWQFFKIWPSSQSVLLFIVNDFIPDTFVDDRGRQNCYTLCTRLFQKKNKINKKTVVALPPVCIGGRDNAEGEKRKTYNNRFEKKNKIKRNTFNGSIDV